ncbi:hypothetical protein VTN02DRAFT_1350 [Thermoascus thermophilus]
MIYSGDNCSVRSQDTYSLYRKKPDGPSNTAGGSSPARAWPENDSPENDSLLLFDLLNPYLPRRSYIFNPLTRSRPNRKPTQKKFLLLCSLSSSCNGTSRKIIKGRGMEWKGNHPRKKNRFHQLSSAFIDFGCPPDPRAVCPFLFFLSNQPLIPKYRYPLLRLEALLRLLH